MEASDYVKVALTVTMFLMNALKARSSSSTGAEKALYRTFFGQVVYQSPGDKPIDSQNKINAVQSHERVMFVLFLVLIWTI